MIRTYWLYFRTGTLWKILKTGYPPFVAGMYPVIFMAAMLLIALAASTLVSWALVTGFGLPWWPCLIVYLAFGAAMVWAALRLEQAVPYLWPVHVYNFAADQVAGRVARFEERIDRFAERIAEYIATSTDDEVLIVGHSNGTSVAVSTVARALARDPGLGRRGPQVSLLTLGQSILLVSLLPGASRFRAELEQLGQDDTVPWIDITAPRDGACFVVTDPIGESGLAPVNASGAPRPKLLSVAMTDLFSPETWRATLKGHWQRIHFQYLMAYEKPTPYDYFAITAGPQSLTARFQAFPSKPPFVKFKLFGK
jgi:pimeloyl-ACP methyl ester carboxylesterase